MIEGKIKGDKVLIGFTRSLESRGFGKRKENYIELAPIEAYYLYLRKKISLIYKNKELCKEEALKYFSKINPRFLIYYKVYEDLRNRGYAVKPENELLIGRKVFLPISEHDELDLIKIARYLDVFGELILSIVDDEFEMTYYEVKKFEENGGILEKIKESSCVFTGIVGVTNNVELFEELFYGKKENDELVELSVFETIYLAEKGKLKLDCNLNDAIKNAKKIIHNFEAKYKIYKDLKDKGFIVKTGLKFGSDFRVYDTPVSSCETKHSRYLVSLLNSERIKINEITRAVRLAQSVGKTKIFALVKGDEILYFQVRRVKP